MIMLNKSSAVYLLAVMCAMIVAPAQAGVQRAYVASYGLDSNTTFDCDVAHPCSLFSAAVTVVNPDGEVVALDSAEYGIVTLNKSISLTAAPGIYAGISVLQGATGVTIATAGVNVVLRGLTINGQGGSASSQGGTIGILMTNGARLSIENCVISNFFINIPSSQYGILVQTAATVRIVNTLLRDNDVAIELQDGVVADISGSNIFGNVTGIFANNSSVGTATTVAISDSVVSGHFIGIYALAQASTTSRVEMVRSIVSNSNTGVLAQSQLGTASVSFRKSMVTGNNDGLVEVGSGATLISYGKNTLSDNLLDILGTLTTLAPQ